MGGVASILNRYEWKHLRPGENDSSFQFNGPGVVVLAQEALGTGQIQIIDVVAAENDALSVAKSMLGRIPPGNEYWFAMLASLSSAAERRDLAAALSKYRKRVVTPTPAHRPSRIPIVRIIAMIALLGVPLYVVGLFTHDSQMADVGASAFILGSIVAGALSLRKRHKQRNRP